jgi:hypothetical protein
VKRLLALTLMGASWMLVGARASAQTVAPPESSSRTISNQDLDLLRRDLRAKRKQLIAANLKLTQAEGQGSGRSMTNTVRN